MRAKEQSPASHRSSKKFLTRRGTAMDSASGPAGAIFPLGLQLTQNPKVEPIDPVRRLSEDVLDQGEALFRIARSQFSTESPE